MQTTRAAAPGPAGESSMEELARLTRQRQAASIKQGHSPVHQQEKVAGRIHTGKEWQAAEDAQGIGSRSPNSPTLGDFLGAGEMQGWETQASPPPGSDEFLEALLRKLEGKSARSPREETVFKKL